MRAVGIILAGGNSRKMKELTSRRAAAAMPVAGSYRAIDFTLSNMTNSHIQKVAVLTQYNARSLNEHLNSSKWWDFGRNRTDKRNTERQSTGERITKEHFSGRGRAAGRSV